MSGISVAKSGTLVDLEDLRTFVEVADAGGVSPAARRLGVSKSIVSRRLARLEAELCVQLLSRTTRGATLTEAGATFRRCAGFEPFAPQSEWGGCRRCRHRRGGRAR